MSDRNLARRTEIKVSFNNVDISEDINKNLISLSYSDESAGAADDLKIVIHDTEGIWIRNWLKREMESRDAANGESALGTSSGTGDETAYTVTAKIGLNVRSGKSTGAERIGGIAYGQTVNVKNISDGWAEIEYSGQTAYVSAQYLTKASGNTGSSGGAYNVGDEVTVTGTPQYSSYGNGRPGAPVTNYKGTITYTNMRDGVKYPIAVDYLGWFALSDVVNNSTEEPTTEDGNNAKYTKISAIIAARNVDGDGTDRVLDCGTFELDNVETSGPPQTVEMSATSVNYESGIKKTVKSRTWQKTNLSAIVGEIAGNSGYEAMYLAAFNPSFERIVQDEERDLEFLSRVCEKYGLSLKVTAGAIVVFDSKEMEQEEPVRKIKFGDKSYSKYKLASSLSTTAYSSCHVSYEDDQGNAYEATFTPETAYSEGEVLEVTEQVDSNEAAMELAKRKLRAANKGEITGSFSMAGDPRLVAGVNVELEGWGDFDGKYSIEKSRHQVKGGYTTDIDIAKVVEGY